MRNTARTCAVLRDEASKLPVQRGLPVGAHPVIEFLLGSENMACLRAMYAHERRCPSQNLKHWYTNCVTADFERNEPAKHKIS